MSAIKEKDPKRAYSYLKRGLRLLIEVDDELIALGARIDKEDFYIDAFLTRKDDLKLFYHGFKLFSDEAEDGITGIKVKKASKSVVAELAGSLKSPFGYVPISVARQKAGEALGKKYSF